MTKQKNISKSVMKEIQDKKIKMKPRTYFIIGSVLLGVGLLGVMALASFFSHLIFFRLRVGGPTEFLRLGRPGVGPFLLSFPWLPLIVALGGLAGGAVLLKRYEISYKKSFWGLVIGLVVLVLGFGYLMDHFKPEKPLSRFKPLRPLYETRFVGENFVVGEVVSVQGHGVLISTPEGKEVKVSWDKSTRLPGGSEVEVGDRFRAVGEWENGAFEAKGVMCGRNDRPHPTRPGVKGVKKNSGQ